MQSTGEWGSFFPAHLSPFGYNETVAQEYFPCSREQALASGFLWSDYQAPAPNVASILGSDQLVDDIYDVDDSILKSAIRCAQSNKLFRLIPQELKLYRSQGLPLPRLHPQERHLKRIAARNPRQLWARQCYVCHLSIQRAYPPQSEALVYCEACYRSAMD